MTNTPVSTAPLNAEMASSRSPSTAERGASHTLFGNGPVPPFSSPAAGQGVPSAEAEQAKATIAELKNDPAFTKAYVSGDVTAKQRMAELHRTAFPETVGDDVPPPATSAEAARAAIEARRADPDFVKRVEEGDPVARAELDDLHAQANPELLPLAFSEDTPIATVAKAQELAQGTADSLGIAPEFARGGVATLERAVSARLDDNGVPKPMDDLELSRMEFLLQERLGGGYDEAMSRAEAALQRAGPGGEWLQRTILSAGPDAAVWAFQTLAGLQGGER